VREKLCAPGKEKVRVTNAGKPSRVRELRPLGKEKTSKRGRGGEPLFFPSGISKKKKKEDKKRGGRAGRGGVEEGFETQSESLAGWKLYIFARNLLGGGEGEASPGLG